MANPRVVVKVELPPVITIFGFTVIKMVVVPNAVTESVAVMVSK